MRFRGNKLLSHVKKFPLKVILIIFISILTLNAIKETKARPNFGDNCLECHQTGVKVTTNATGSIEVEPNSVFYLEVSVQGGANQDTFLLWYNSSHNEHFDFHPREVKDNDPNDEMSDEGSITTVFKIVAPAVEGNYTLKTYSVSARSLGGSTEVKVTVGKGGDIPATSMDGTRAILSKTVPDALAGISVVVMFSYFLSWRRINGETPSW